MLKLVNEKTNDISVSDMKDGDLAIITKWWNSPTAPYVGMIVQRYAETLIVIGKESIMAWPSLFSKYRFQDCRVRLLEKGETLVVE